MKKNVFMQKNRVSLKRSENKIKNENDMYICAFVHFLSLLFTTIQKFTSHIFHFLCTYVRTCLPILILSVQFPEQNITLVISKP